MIAAAVSAHESMGNVKIMFASLGAYGHLYPMMPLALACAAAGVRHRAYHNGLSVVASIDSQLSARRLGAAEPYTT
jgi:hypothetical protein